MFLQYVAGFEITFVPSLVLFIIFILIPMALVVGIVWGAIKLYRKKHPAKPQAVYKRTRDPKFLIIAIPCGIVVILSVLILIISLF